MTDVDNKKNASDGITKIQAELEEIRTAILDKTLSNEDAHCWALRLGDGSYLVWNGSDTGSAVDAPDDGSPIGG